MEKLAYTKVEAAEQLGISTKKLEQIIHRGDIKVKKDGRRVIIPRTSLEKYLEVE